MTKFHIYIEEGDKLIYKRSSYHYEIAVKAAESYFQEHGSAVIKRVEEAVVWENGKSPAGPHQLVGTEAVN